MVRDKEWIEKRIERIPESGCWVWMGAVHKHYGHGKYRDHGAKAYFVHRLSWECYKGPIPERMFVLHKCDVSCCVNPDHLFLGTQSDNAKDMWLKGRGWARR